MSADASAYRALGLQPGANAAAVEAAYRRLIKRYHPDVRGGDPARAAEINWAFDQIRKRQNRGAQLVQRAPRYRNYPIVGPQPALNRRRRLHLVPLALAAAVAYAIVFDADRIGDTFEGFGRSLADPRAVAGPFRGGGFVGGPAEVADAPLDSDGIDRSVHSAVRIARDGGLDRLTNQSRRCHAELRRSPAVARLDQCVAFDEAAIVLTQRDESEAEGQFSAASVTARQLGAARLMSDDFLAIESRLDQIRSRVEFELAPADHEPLARRPG
jgi:hypothetical protein